MTDPTRGSGRRRGGKLARALDAARLLSQIGRDHSTVLDRRFAGFGLTTQQAALLIHASDQPVSPSHLTKVLGTDTAGMTRLVDRLEAKGLLYRRPHAEDRRAILIEITEAGRELVPALPPVFGQATGQLFAGFTSDEIIALDAMFLRMRANLAAAAEQP
ncbi:MarR family winged helix-turn-helix transcriptional regulator [Dactylosporangium sp. CA-092794]|uniref:MarR family winged helix-turn-helix transcriptional regulator n=1 Tax=Dactylosporangium sp. CA-092794 TaxID=3239929 RepID=UPI003D8B9770